MPASSESPTLMAWSCFLTMRFLRWFWRSLVAISQNKPETALGDSGLARWPVHSGENVARFIFSRSHFTTNPPRVKFNAFLPPADLELSVYRTSGLQEVEIWELGKTRVAVPSGRTLKARGDFRAGSVRGSLSIQR